MEQCKTCWLIEQRDLDDAPLWDCIFRTEFFDVAHAYNTSLPGWIVVVAKRHVAAIHELSEGEAIELGTLLRQVSVGLKNVLGCAKTYVMQFAEQTGHSHVNFHVVPRMNDLPDENKGVNVFKYLGVDGQDRVPESLMNDIAAKLQNEIGTA